MLCVFQDAVSSCSCFVCTVILHLWCHLCLCAHFESFCRVFCVFIWSQTASSSNHNMNDWKRYEIMFVFCSRFACLNFFSSVVFSLSFFAVSHFVLCRLSHFVELVLRFLDPNSQSVSCQCLYYIMNSFAANVFTWVFQVRVQLLIH